jgi:hypothetical protein
MNEIILELITELGNQKINKEQFLVKFSLKTGIALNDEFCLKHNFEISYLTKDGCPTYYIKINK